RTARSSGPLRTHGGGRAGTCGTSSSWGGALALASRLIELRRILGLLRRGRRVGCVRNSRRGRLDLRLDRRLLTALGRGRLLVGARPFDVVLTARAVARCSPAS